MERRANRQARLFTVSGEQTRQSVQAPATSIPFLRSRGVDAGILVATITVCGAILRLEKLGSKPLWVDEAGLWLIAQGHDVTTVLSTNAHSNSAPPLFALVTHMITSLSSAPTALRLVSAVGSIAAIPSMYLLSITLWSNRNAAYVSAAIMAVATSQIQYAQQVREYGLVVILTALLLLVGWQVATNPNIRKIATFALLETLSVATQYGLVWVIVISLTVSLIALHERKNWQAIRLLVVLQALPGVMAVIVYFTTTRDQLQAGGFGSSGYLAYGYWDHSWRSLAALAIGRTYHLIGFSLTSGVPATVTGIVCIALGLVAIERKRMSRLLFTVLLGPVVLTFLLGLLHVYPYVPARQDMFLTVPLILLTGWGIAFALSWRPKMYSLLVVPVFTALLTLGLVFPVYSHAVAYFRWDGPEAIDKPLHTLAQQRPGDWLYVSAYALPAFIYDRCHAARCPAILRSAGDTIAAGDSVTGTRTGSLIIGGARSNSDASHAYDPVQVAAIVHGGHRIWYLFSHNNDAARDAILLPARHIGHVVAVVNAEGSSLYLFSPNREH